MSVSLYRSAILWLWVMALLVGCALEGQTAALLPGEVAAEIRANYEQALPRLPASKQRHYAQRLYRVTGDERFLPLNRAYGLRLLTSLRQEIDGLAEPGYAPRRAREKVADYPARSLKQQRRKHMLGEWGEIVYAKSLAFQLTQASYHGLLDEEHLPGYRRALAYLEGLDFRPFLIDPEVMEIYAAQVANLVYYLHHLGVADLRDPVIAAFRRHYPVARDGELSRASYRNKIYGMTHFVIAASDYYQRRVPEGEVEWILDYFASHLDRIIVETKADIYTEVGISFLLAGREDHPAVQRLREALVRAYDPRARMVPSESGGTDLSFGEHRNVLAIMLLGWPGRLHPGPMLELPAQERESAAIAGMAASSCGARALWICR
ncbi:DUF3541 domain-containing protein [Halomonas nitroreducens]|uniref:DUF3541 domain-containing protein n=1 Tax=Halomonas nitroreducens TaxID=447425 RepID=A0A3S0HRI1_9GAMM|nr:DUF3541 domain-containing protein [Halomonas nitroreducens]RTQ99894.1 DUF3541 domain-containing protein [Halomonas nitroreducens]